MAVEKKDFKTPTTTADGEIEYAPYDEKVQMLHETNCDAYKWAFTPLKPGSYGYDNLVRCIYEVEKFRAEKKEVSQLEVAAVVHDAWVKNYVYWRDNIDKIMSAETTETRGAYRKPYNPIGDDRRNKCAATAFADLDEEERLKDMVIAAALLGLPSAVA